ncbi:hypothetical protein L2E82_11114 [Cichorium intybus]|uniref:Uncharacterized protein n=1 Tax=Cichorium intybus TaxID=13427 RepID=A0ACB9GDH2_CICIN|nr:hypothetical protein L2E82_11114 [Cichorium intybus]
MRLNIMKDSDAIALELKLGFRKPEVIIIVGVNGGGKTTSLGKLTYRLKSQGATFFSKFDQKRKLHKAEQEDTITCGGMKSCYIR